MDLLVMRVLADGRIRWGFWPPGSESAGEGVGIWLEGSGYDEKEVDGGSEDELASDPGVGEVSGVSGESISGESRVSGEEEDGPGGEGEEEEEEDDDHELNGKGEHGVEDPVKVGGFFAALGVDSDEDSEEEEDGVEGQVE